MFHELYSVSSLLCIARNVRFEIPYKVLCFETPFLMIFKYYAWASYGYVTQSRFLQKHFHETRGTSSARGFRCSLPQFLRR